MSESVQQKIGRIRPPRVQITYDVEIGGAIQMRELPFLLGIMADLSGLRDTPLPGLKDRKFVEIDRDNFPDIMVAIGPKLHLSVPNRLEADATSNFVVDLTFTSMDDFSPIALIHNIAPLKELYDARTRLNDLVAKLDGNDDLFEVLTAIGKDKAQQDAALKDAKKAVEDGKMILNDNQLDGAKAMIEEYVKQVQAAGGSVDENVMGFLHKCIHDIDTTLGAQIDEILHAPEFQHLEGTWRGLHFLVYTTETGKMLKLRILNVSKKELLQDLERAVEFDQSQLFKKVYEDEYGTFGGTPYSCLMGGYEFGRHPQDIELLEKISNVAAAAHAPFIAAATPEMFDLERYAELNTPRDLGKIFESSEMIKWNSFRKTEDSRYVSLALPRVLMRLPYGPETTPVPEFNYKETVDGHNNDKFCWGNAAYALSERITNAFAHYKWCAAIRGVEGGGLVTGLPAYTFKTLEGDVALKCPTEVAITDRREKELSDLGFIGLCHSKGTDFAAFFGAQTAQEPLTYDTDSANANARLSAKLTYILAASRFAHYIKAIMRDKVGSFMSRQDVSNYLNRWIANYILVSDNASQAVKAQYPLREGRVDVFDDPGRPGCYKATVFLRPHFQLEELTVSIRLVATLPPPAA